MNVQVYATSMAMLVTTVVSVLFFGLQPSLQLLLGIVTASISLALYYVSPNLLLETGKAQKLPR
jgi:UDP-sugar transporter A1/2/3